MSLDFLFHYRYNLRNLLILKFNKLNNSFMLPRLSKIILFFVIRKLDLLDQPKIYNYFYLVRFFFGKRAFINKYNSYFSLGKTYYNFDIVSIFTNIDMYPAIYFFVNDVQPFVNLKLARNYYFRSNSFFSLLFWDLNVFTEKKTNIGLYDLCDPLQFKIYFTGVKPNSISAKFLLTGLKLIKGWEN